MKISSYLLKLGKFSVIFADVKTIYFEEKKMRLGEKIAVLRIECGDSQEYLADFFGVSSDYLLKEHVEINENNGLERVVLRFLAFVQDMHSISRVI